MKQAPKSIAARHLFARLPVIIGKQLTRLVSAYLDIAEDMAIRQIPMTMQDWETRLNSFIEATDRKVLQDAGRVTAEIAKAHAEAEFEKYRIVQDRLFQSDFDRFLQDSTQQ